VKFIVKDKSFFTQTNTTMETNTFGNTQKHKQEVKMPSDYIWPLSKSMTPDEVNTSFAPRINRNEWDFHDGIDLPARP